MRAARKLRQGEGEGKGTHNTHEHAPRWRPFRPIELSFFAARGCPSSLPAPLPSLRRALGALGVREGRCPRAAKNDSANWKKASRPFFLALIKIPSHLAFLSKIPSDAQQKIPKRTETKKAEKVTRDCDRTASHERGTGGAPQRSA
eukprot:5043978-Prymnesium_polylepis.1